MSRKIEQDLTPPEGWRVLELEQHTSHLHRIGPIFYRRNEDGGQEFACRAQPWNLNNASNIHGGVLMSLADFSACSVAMRNIEDIVATISFSAEFLQPGPAGALLICRAEQLRSTDSFSFLRGQIFNRHRIVLNFSATVKRMRRRSAEVSDADGKA